MSQYPTLSRMARDYLAIQGSAVPSERAFSSGGITATSRCNRLSADTFESLQLLKSAYRNGHVMAADQAVAHLKTLWDEVDLRDIVEENGDVL
jgi:hAT family C-terminal dimerisation region